MINNKEYIAYLTGFFDGEGCVSIGKNGSVQLRVINTSLRTLQLFYDVFGGSIGTRSQRVNKKQYSWSIYGIDAINFASTIKQFSIDKKDQLVSIIEYWCLRNKLETIHHIGKRGRKANPIRTELVSTYRTLLTKMKKESDE